MSNTKELSLQERSTKRANFCLTITITLVSVYLMFLYLAQILQNLVTTRKAIIVAIMIMIPPIISFICYKKTPTSKQYRKIAFIAYLLVYEVACLSSTNFLYNFFCFRF